MSRHWKIVIALAAVGIAAFLIWAFRSPVTPPLTIRFAGYMTNQSIRVTSEPLSTNGLVFAIFAVTNQTRHQVLMEPYSLTRSNGTEINMSLKWIRPSNVPIFAAPKADLLAANGGILIGARIEHADEPVRVLVQGRSLRQFTSPWHRFWGRMPWNESIYSTSAVSGSR